MLNLVNLKNLNRSLKLIISFILVVNTICLGLVTAEETKVITLGGKTGWSGLSKMENVSVGKGRFGYDAIELETNSHGRDSDTDLLLNFETGKIEDLCHNYNVDACNAICSENSIMGKYAALVRGNGGITLAGKSTAIFGKRGITGSFLIEFWLCPSIVENGEILFSWRSSRTVANYPLYQMIGASFQNNHLSWNFTNVFNGYTSNNGEITLSSYRTIIPEKWAHHQISFDEETGLMEYRIDGKLEALKYITSNSRERGGSIYEPQLGVVADIEICPQFTGLIDDFRIQHGINSESAKLLRYDTYKNMGGRFETEPMLISKGAVLNQIDAIVNEPAQTEVAFYVRSGDNYYNWTDTKPEWIPVKNHESLKNITGLYFQIAADLFPDGGGSHSPSVTQIDISYTEVPPPLPPYNVFASAGDKEVTLSWVYSVDASVQGYYVFYGDRPGEYLGSDAAEGPSPIDVGNHISKTLTGLKNGKIYYFTIVPYSRAEDKIMGELSKEVYARPMRK